MREWNVERSWNLFKRKRKCKKDVEYEMKEYLNGLSFMVTDHVVLACPKYKLSEIFGFLCTSQPEN